MMSGDVECMARASEGLVERLFINGIGVGGIKD